MMSSIQPNLHNEFVNYDEIIRISIFHTKEIDGSSKHWIQECNHLGYLVKDGEVVQPLIGTMIQGNVFDMLMNITGISKEKKTITVTK